MCTSMADLKKAGIHSATDLIKFPWDHEDADMPDEKDVNDILATLRAMRKKKEATD